MSYQGADDDNIWFGSTDHILLDEKEGLLSEEQVQALGAEDDGIDVVPVADVLEVPDNPDEEEQVDGLDAEDDWIDFALIPDVPEVAVQEVHVLAAEDDVIQYALIPDVPEVADLEQVHVPAVEDDVIDYAAALVADEEAAYLEYNFAALNFDQVSAVAVQSEVYFEDDVYSSDEDLYGKDLEVPFYDIHPLKKAAKLGAKGMLKKKGNLAPRRAEKLAAKIRRGGSYGTSEGTAIITYGSYGENGLEF